MVTFADFIGAMEDKLSLSEAERQRLASLWPPAERAAQVCLSKLPSIGVLSFTRRFKAFLFVSKELNIYVAKGLLNQEQAQLALTIMRLQSRNYQKAEAMFAARATRLNHNDLVYLPETAQVYLQAIRHYKVGV